MTKQVSTTRNFVVDREHLLLLRYHEGWTCSYIKEAISSTFGFHTTRKYISRCLFLQPKYIPCTKREFKGT
jgi:hypothetical protein